MEKQENKIVITLVEGGGIKVDVSGGIHPLDTIRLLSTATELVAREYGNEVFNPKEEGTSEEVQAEIQE